MKSQFAASRIFKSLKKLHNCVVQAEDFGELLVVHVGEPCFAGVHGQVGDGFFGFEERVDFLFEGAFGDKAVDLDVALLTDTEGAVGGLRFDGGVPPQIVMDDLRGGDEVETGATCFKRENEHFAVWIFLEILDHFGALRLCATAVIEMGAESEFLFNGGFQQVTHFGKLREDERLLALFLDRFEEVQEHLHLAGFELAGFRNVGQDFTGSFAPLRMTLGRRVHIVLFRGVGGAFCGEAFQECGGVVADLLEGKNHLQNDAFTLEECVGVVCLIAEGLLFFELGEEVIEGALVKGCLRASEFGVFVLDDFIGQVADDALIGLETAQHERCCDFAECFGDNLVAVLLNRRFKLFAEFACAREKTVVRKIHDGPEFHEAVFDWSAAHRDFHRGAHAAEQFTLFAIGVLDVLRFVDDNRLPFNFVKFGEVLAERGVSREQHVGVEFLQIAAAAVVREEREIRRELLDFNLPVAKEAGGHHDDGFFLREFALLFHLEEEGNEL